MAEVLFLKSVEFRLRFRLDFICDVEPAFLLLQFYFGEKGEVTGDWVKGVRRMWNYRNVVFCQKLQCLREM